MVRKRVLSPRPILDEPSLLSFFQERGVKELHAKSLWSFIVNNRPQSLRECLNAGLSLPTGLIEALEPHFVITTSKVVTREVASDGTTKLLVELQDGQRVSAAVNAARSPSVFYAGSDGCCVQVEAVIIRHDGRNTLCVSSQIGCQVGSSSCVGG